MSDKPDIVGIVGMVLEAIEDIAEQHRLSVADLDEAVRQYLNAQKKLPPKRKNAQA